MPTEVEKHLKYVPGGVLEQVGFVKPIPRNRLSDSMRLQAEEEECKWVTIHGRAVCIKPGETPEQAFKRIEQEVPGKPKEKPEVAPEKKKYWTPEKKEEWRKRSKLAREKSKVFEDYDKDVAKELRYYKSGDLESVELRYTTGEGFDNFFGEEGASDKWGGFYAPLDKRIVVNSQYRAISPNKAITHEMGHHIAKMRHGTTRPSWCRKFLRSKAKKDSVRKYISSYALTNEAELFAEGFELMRTQPKQVRYAMEQDSVIRAFFNQLQKESGYRIRKKSKK
ncbi:MAG: hypothetical protein HWN68_02360 [Desulfobacterales bacterium]|nr:hypothetical protein [Desulfobacterales bacterium]